MLTNFDLFCESVLTEGRKSDDKKKFKFDPEKAREHVGKIGEKHHHFIHDKGHFSDLIEELSPEEVYTPKSFIEHAKEIMKGKGKAQIADGYAKLLYTFLGDRLDSPFVDHDPNAEVEEIGETEEEEPEFDAISPDHDDSINA
jgi:hypothetical protein